MEGEVGLAERFAEGGLGLALAAGGPFPIVRHDVDPLVIAHFVTLYKAG